MNAEKLAAALHDLIETCGGGGPVTNNAREALAAHRAQADKQGDAEPLFWYRPCRDGLYEGPVHHKSVGGTMLRAEKPGEWFPLYASPHQVAQWRDIETAPENTALPVVVGWRNTDGEVQSCFDYREDGCWMEWHDHVDHVHMIGGHGVSETPPYTHWMPLPAAPTKEPTNG